MESAKVSEKQNSILGGEDDSAEDKSWMTMTDRLIGRKRKASQNLTAFKRPKKAWISINLSVSTAPSYRHNLYTDSG